jgi:hypothetical protein
MKSKMLAVVAIAAGLSVAAAGTASAAPLKHKPAAQVTGARLETAMLPPSAFGTDMHSVYLAGTGKKLWSSYSVKKVASTECGLFETYNFSPAFGKTAQAQAGADDPDSRPYYPFATIVGFQYVSQFASAKAAVTFYNQERAKFKSCVSFTWPNPVNTIPGSGKINVSTMSVSNAVVGRYPAFWSSQLAAYSELPGFYFNINTLVAVAGKDVYLIYEISGNNDEPSPALMSRLISRVQKLY